MGNLPPHPSPSREDSPLRAYVLRELALSADQGDADLPAAVAGFLRIKRSRIGAVRILRKSLDSRKRNQPLWRYSVEFEFDGELKHPRVSPASSTRAEAVAAPAYRPAGSKVAVIGSGPAGLA